MGFKSAIPKALLVAFVVGNILTLINQWDFFFHGAPLKWGPFLLTFCVPFCVFMYGHMNAEIRLRRLLQQYNCTDALVAVDMAPDTLTGEVSPTKVAAHQHAEDLAKAKSQLENLVDKAKQVRAQQEAEPDQPRPVNADGNWMNSMNQNVQQMHSILRQVDQMCDDIQSDTRRASANIRSALEKSASAPASESTGKDAAVEPSDKRLH